MLALLGLGHFRRKASICRLRAEKFKLTTKLAHNKNLVKMPLMSVTGCSKRSRGLPDTLHPTNSHQIGKIRIWSRMKYAKERFTSWTKKEKRSPILGTPITWRNILSKSSHPISILPPCSFIMQINEQNASKSSHLCLLKSWLLKIMMLCRSHFT